jgi:hypothetical protein
MDLHGNAALSWSGRRQLARRVVEQGWSLKAAAEAAGVSVRCARSGSAGTAPAIGSCMTGPRRRGGLRIAPMLGGWR